MLASRPAVIVAVALASATSAVSSPGHFERLFRQTGATESDALGSRIAVGDWNADGHNDLAVAATLAYSHVGLIYVIYASADFPDSVHMAIIPGRNRGDMVGFALSGDGDVNGDGIDDLLIGAHLRPTPSDVQVHFGSQQGLSETPSMVLYGDVERDYFGYSVAAFDVNRDGWKDVVVGADDDGTGLQGAVWTFFGGPELDPVVDDLIIGYPRYTDNLGSNLAAMGDVTGDGFPNLVIGDHDIKPIHTNGYGRAFLTTGTDAGTLENLDTLPGAQYQCQYSWGLAALGDWDGDGFEDFAIGAPRYDAMLPDQGKATAAGHLEIFHGGNPFIPETADTLNGPVKLARFGEAVWGRADVDKDGWTDMVVGAPGYNQSRGRVTIYFGGEGVTLATARSQTIDGTNPGSEWGVAVGLGLDLDLDGWQEFAIGAAYDSEEAYRTGAFEIWEWTPNTEAEVAER